MAEPTSRSRNRHSRARPQLRNLQRLVHGHSRAKDRRRILITHAIRNPNKERRVRERKLRKRALDIHAGDAAPHAEILQPSGTPLARVAHGMQPAHADAVAHAPHRAVDVRAQRRDHARALVPEHRDARRRRQGRGCAPREVHVGAAHAAARDADQELRAGGLRGGAEAHGDGFRGLVVDCGEGLGGDGGRRHGVRFESGLWFGFLPAGGYGLLLFWTFRAL